MIYGIDREHDYRDIYSTVYIVAIHYIALRYRDTSGDVMVTELLYQKDSYIKEFTAIVQKVVD
ncbi:MAG: hypothetical protein QXV06_07385, partial [Ignisphaera sp.]